MSTVIKVENVSKSFMISHEERENYIALRDVLSKNAKGLFRFGKFFKSHKAVTREEFYALKDLSFEVQQGERVGIIGRNGAGKSTLLKLLSRITEPSSGSISIKGRVATLLEVGTGFHPELTGRENIFLNGAICGMSRMEIKAKFDEIVSFAEVEKFLDTPVKRYSSGMYVRLAFSVAAHLEPEILIIDEVLAVGDIQFQKKCLGKIEEVNSRDGRTVLFVSHDLSAIERICSRAILLKDGRIDAQGSVQEVLSKYSSMMHVSQGSIEFVSGVRLDEFVLGNDLLEQGKDLSFRISISFSKSGNNSLHDLAILIYDHKGIRVSVVDLRYELRRFSPDDTLFTISGKLLNLNLVQGVYFIGLYAGAKNKYQNLFNLATLEIKPAMEGYTHKSYDPQHLGVMKINYVLDSAI